MPENGIRIKRLESFGSLNQKQMETSVIVDAVNWALKKEYRGRVKALAYPFAGLSDVDETEIAVRISESTMRRGAASEIIGELVFCIVRCCFKWRSPEDCQDQVTFYVDIVGWHDNYESDAREYVVKLGCRVSEDLRLAFSGRRIGRNNARNK